MVAVGLVAAATPPVYPSPQRLCQRVGGLTHATQTAFMNQFMEYVFKGNGTVIKGLLHQEEMIPYFNGSITDGDDYYTDSAAYAAMKADAINYNYVMLGCINVTGIAAVESDAAERPLFLVSAVRTAYIKELKEAITEYLPADHPATGEESELVYVDARYGPALKGGSPNAMCTESTCKEFVDFAELALALNGSEPQTLAWLNTKDEHAAENIVHVLTGGNVAWRMPIGYKIEQIDALGGELVTGGFESEDTAMGFTHLFPTAGTFYYRTHGHHSVQGTVVVADRKAASDPVKTHSATDTEYGATLGAVVGGSIVVPALLSMISFASA
jgi:hypothetical protein